MPLGDLELILSAASDLNFLTISGGVWAWGGFQVTAEDLEKSILKMRVLSRLRIYVIDGVECLARGL